MLGKQLKEFRKAMTFPSGETAKIIGISTSYLSQIENERRLPTKDILVKLLYTLSKYSTITELNKDEFLNEQTYHIWRNKVQLDHDENADWDTTVDIYDGSDMLIDSIPVDTENLNTVIEDTLKNYFYNFSYRNSSDYLDYKNGKFTEPEKHRFARNIRFFDDFNIDKKLIDWWITYFKQQLKETLDNNSQNLNTDEETLYRYIINFDFSNYSPNSVDKNNVNIQQLLLHNKKVVFDLELLRHRNLIVTIDGERLSPKDLYALELIISGIKKSYNKDEM